MKKTYVLDTNVLIQAPYALHCFEAVSYTHLDVYKRQVSHKIYLEKCLTALRGEADGI